jgi:hypothetical protein
MENHASDQMDKGTTTIEHLKEGAWFCADCERRCERVEGENGQPAHCHRCGSHRINFFKLLS